MGARHGFAGNRVAPTEFDLVAPGGLVTNLKVADGGGPALSE